MANSKSLRIDLIKQSVLSWLNNLKVDSGLYFYHFSLTSGNSIFTTCFALFILDMFKATDNISEDEKKSWVDYINSFQREKDGLFYPDPVLHPDKERAVFQATCFCLSALSILGFAPRYQLTVVDQWKTAHDVEEYLIQRGCHRGDSGSGNKAMFLAIFLTHEYERTGNNHYKELMNSWFAFHEKNKNSLGFFGQKKSDQWYGGLQNALHQLVIYEYWNREYSHLNNAAVVARKLQGWHGHFSPNVFGDACKDYDSIHVLLMAVKRGIIINDLDKIISKTTRAILKLQNNDGGFPDSGYRNKNIATRTMAQKIHILISPSYNVSKTRALDLFKELRGEKKLLIRRWVKEGQPFNESTLWDTWFRCLLIADVINHYYPDESNKYFRFHKHIGLGFNTREVSI